jgi:hypothetical protein
MNRRDLIAHLNGQGCVLHRHGANHDLWRNPRNNIKAALAATSHDQEAVSPRHLP